MVHSDVSGMAENVKNQMLIRLNRTLVFEETNVMREIADFA